MSGGAVVQEFHGFSGNCFRIIEWNQRAALLVQQLDRMQVWRRNDCFASTQGVCKRTGNDLRFVLVRRNVNIRRPD